MAKPLPITIITLPPGTPVDRVELLHAFLRVVSAYVERIDGIEDEPTVMRAVLTPADVRWVKTRFRSAVVSSV